MVEHRTLTAVVAGSNPVSLAKVNKHLTRRENLVIIAKWAVIELGFLAALQAVIEGFDSLTVHQNA